MLYDDDLWHEHMYRCCFHINSFKISFKLMAKVVLFNILWCYWIGRRHRVCNNSKLLWTQDNIKIMYIFLSKVKILLIISDCLLVLDLQWCYNWFYISLSHTLWLQGNNRENVHDILFGIMLKVIRVLK